MKLKVASFFSGCNCKECGIYFEFPRSFKREFCSNECRFKNSTTKIDVDMLKELYYEKNHSINEVAKIMGVGYKVVSNTMKRNNLKARKAVKRNQLGSNNSRWKGNDAGYKALHLRVSKARGKASTCRRCDDSKNSTYEWANLTGNYEDVNDYESMCRPCHNIFDATRRRETGTNTIPERLYQ